MNERKPGETPEKRFGEIVLELCPHVTKEQIEKAVEIKKGTREPLGQVLVNMQVITEKERQMCWGKQIEVPFVDLAERTIDKDMLKETKIPPHLMKKHRMIPLEKKNRVLTLAMANPIDIYAIQDAQLVSGCQIEPVVATEDDIMQAINEALGEGEVETVLEELEKKQTGAIEEVAQEEEEIGLEQLRELAEDEPIIKLSHHIIRQAIEERASDIHIQPEAKRLRVRYRVDGVMHDEIEVPKSKQAPLISRLKVMANMKLDEKRRPQDGRIGVKVEGREFDIRVSTYPGIYGEKIVMRLLDKSSVALTLNKLGMPMKLQAQFNKVINQPYGIVLVCGPTGSGKSTTLQAVLHQLNSDEKNIITIEDPVEYEVPGVTQAQVNPAVEFTFASAMRTILRQDPDIILVGEIRDVETAEMAIEAALTGHMVFSTIHTNDAPQAVTRLVEMGIEPFLVTATVVGALAQRLVRVICPRCKEEYQPPPDALERVGIVTEEGKSYTFYRGSGRDPKTSMPCRNCRGKGYFGRIGVFELMVMTDELRDLILKGAPAHALRERAIEAGMITLQDDVIQKILQGITTVEDALSVVYAE